MMDALDREYFEKTFTELERGGYGILVQRLRQLLPADDGDSAGQLELVDGAIVPVTDAHVRIAWDQLYQRAEAFKHIDVRPPNPTDIYDKLTLDGLRRILETDRLMVARLTRAQDPALAAGETLTRSSTQEEEQLV